MICFFFCCEVIFHQVEELTDRLTNWQDSTVYQPSLALVWTSVF